MINIIIPFSFYFGFVIYELFIQTATAVGGPRQAILIQFVSLNYDSPFSSFFTQN